MSSTPEKRNSFHEANMKKIEDVETRHKNLREKARITRRLTPDQLYAFEINNEEEVKQFWQTAFDAQVQFEADREHGLPNLSKETTGLAATAYNILRDFSAMVEVVKDFGSPFGNVAIGTLCCLFAVAKNRVSMEENIEITLKAIKDRLPGLSMYRHIYNEDHGLDQLLQSSIVDTYAAFVNYCMEAIEFYTRGSCHRLMQTFTSQNRLSQKADMVKQAVVNVRLVCEEALGKNVNGIKKKLEEVQMSNESLRAQIRELREHNNTMTMNQIRILLNLHDFSWEDHHSELDSHRRDVEVEFWPKTWHGEQEQMQHIGQITSDQKFKAWRESKGSGMFVISGENEYDRAHNCWASKVALDLINDRLTTETCAFHVFGRHEHENTCLHVLSSLIYQILHLNREILRDQTQLDEILAKLGRYQRAMDDNDKQKALEDVASRVLKMVSGDKAVWIVLDRVDRCCSQVQHQSPTGRISRQGARAILNSLSRVTLQGANVKVLAIVNRTDWRVDSDDEDIGDAQEHVTVKRFCQVN